MKTSRALLSLFAAAALAGCNLGIEPPCGSADECGEGLVCRDGTCVVDSPADSGSGGGTGGGGATGGGVGGGGGGGGDDAGTGGGGGATGGGGGGDDAGTGGGGGGATGGGAGDDAGTGGGGGGGDEDGGTDAGLAPAQLRATPASYDFAATRIGDSSAEVSFTVQNIGGEPTRALTAQLSTTAAGFSLTDNTCTGALGAGGTCRVATRFAPTDAGTRQATLSVTEAAPDAGAGASVAIRLDGEGVTGATLGISPATHDFGPLVLGASPLQRDFMVRNLSGTASGTLTTEFTSSQGFFAVTDDCQGATLAPMASCTVRVGFSPTSAGAKSAALRVTGMPGGVVSAPLSGLAQAAAQLAITPGTATFTSQVVGGASATIDFTVRNTGDAPAMGVTAQVGAGDFAATANGCTGVTLMGNGTCTVTVQFTPTAVGTRTGLLSASGTGLSTQQATLEGTGLAPANLVALSTAYAFGNVPTGASSTATLTFRNTGGIPTGAPTVTSAPLPPFSIDQNTCVSGVAPGTTCTVTVRFAPTATAASMDTLSLTANPGGVASTTLSGTGITPGQLTITPTSQAFADTLINQSATPFIFTVRNTGAAATGVPVVALGGSGASQFDFLTNCNMALAPTDTCTVTVRFSPTVRATHSAQLNVTASPGGTVVASVSGRGLTPASLSMSPQSFAFGQQLTGSTTTQSFTVTNTGDQASSVIAAATTPSTPFSIEPTGTTCQGVPLAFNQSCVVVVRYQPTVAGNTFAGQVTATATTGGSASASLSGSAITPATLTLAAQTSANWGSVLVGTKNPRQFTITNTGQQASGPLSFAVSGDDENFPVSTDPTMGWCQPGQTLAGGASCQFTVTFQPASSGMKSVTLQAAASPGGSPTLTLTGTAQDPATLTGATAHNFNGVEVGTTANFMWPLSNTGDVPTGAITFTAGAPFTVTGCAAGINPNSTCTATVTFSPTAGGSNTLTINASSASGATASLTATGNGQWRLTFTAPPSGAQLRTSDSSLVCGTTCTGLFNHLSSVTVQAVTTNGSNVHFQGWSAPNACAARGTGNVCTLPVAGHTTYTATWGTAGSNYNLVFTSSTLEPANRGSLAAYDTQCNALATAAGINNSSGTAFVAWMSTSTSNMTARLPSTSGAFRRMDGALVAINRAALLGGSVLAQIDLDETGKKIPAATASTWTGTNADGTNTTGQDCSGWTSTTGNLNRGRTAGGPGLWTTGTGGHTCNNTGTRIYCFGKTSSTTGTLPTVPSLGKVLFVSPAVAIGASGYTTPDAWCNSVTNKPTGFSTRTFVALVATSTATAASRLNLSAQYYRPDGIYLGSGRNLQDEVLNAGPWVSNLGAYLVNVFAWTGAASMTANATSFNCSNWSTGTSTSQVGRTNSAADDFFDGAGTANACSTARPFYCVEP